MAEKTSGAVALPVAGPADSGPIPPSVSAARAGAKRNGRVGPAGGRPGARIDASPAPSVGPAGAKPLPEPATSAPVKRGWFDWLWGRQANPEAEFQPEPSEAFDWKEEDVALLGDAPFDTGYILTGGDYWLKFKEQARKSYRNFVYVFRKLKLSNPVFIVLGIACLQYFTALAKAIGLYWGRRKMAEAKQPEKKDAAAAK